MAGRGVGRDGYDLGPVASRVSRAINKAAAVLDGDEANSRYWYTLMDIWGEYMALGNMSFAAPSARIGGDGFAGAIRDVKITLGS